jgi:hypothetical protein
MQLVRVLLRQWCSTGEEGHKGVGKRLEKREGAECGLAAAASAGQACERLGCSVHAKGAGALAGPSSWAVARGAGAGHGEGKVQQWATRLS